MANAGEKPWSLAARDGLEGRTITLAERLLAGLPVVGAVVLVGSLSGDADPAALSGPLAESFFRITTRPVLHIRVGRSRPGEKTELTSTSDNVSPGVTEILRGGRSLDSILGSPPASGVAYLGLGEKSGSASEILVTSAFRTFIEATMGRYPWIFLSCPDLLQQHHVASLVARSTTVVGLLRTTLGTAESVRALKDLCDNLGKPLAGIALC